MTTQDRVKKLEAAAGLLALHGYIDEHDTVLAAAFALQNITGELDEAIRQRASWHAQWVDACEVRSRLEEENMELRNKLAAR